MSQSDTEHGQQGVTASREERNIGTDGARGGGGVKEKKSPEIRLV